MNRTEWLQGTVRMRFLEAYDGWQARRLTQEEAARLLGVCERTFRRYIDRYEEAGPDGLIDKRLNQVSHRRAPVDEVMKLVEHYRHRHEGWRVKHFHAGYRRDRGSHDWTTPEAGGKADKVHLTQFGEAMKRLGIEMIPAYSPEARGRSERAFAAHRARLPKELALAGLTDLAAAHRYLEEVYRPAFNRGFSHPAREESSAFVPCLGDNLDDRLREQHERVVSKDNCVRFEGLVLRIPRGSTSLPLRQGHRAGPPPCRWESCRVPWAAAISILGRRGPLGST